MSDDRIRKLINDALPIATVLQKIVFDFYYLQSHEWSTTAAINIVDGRPFGKPPVVIDRTEIRPKYQTAVAEFGPAWFTFVSQTAIDVAARGWTIRQSDGRMAKKRKTTSRASWYLRVGVTTSASSFVIPDGGATATDRSWMIDFCTKNIYHNDGVLLIRSFTYLKPDDLPDTLSPFVNGYCFEADPQRRRIVCRLPSGRYFDEFWSIRPCCAIAGRVGAVVESAGF